MALIDMSETYQMTNVGDHIDGTDVYQSNRNLLDNPWFTVNQRGFTSGAIDIQEYTRDRWKNARVSSVVYNDNGTLTYAWNGNAAGAFLSQYAMPDIAPMLVGKTVTVSAFIDGTLYSKPFVLPSTGTVEYVLGDGVTIVVINQTGTNRGFEFQFRHQSTTGKTIGPVKCELGSVSTLANDAPPDYETELDHCRKYFYRIKAETGFGIFGNGYCSSGNLSYISIPINMRITPTSGSPSGAFRLMHGGGITTGVTLTYSGNSNSHMVRFDISQSGSSWAAGSACILSAHNDSTAYIDLSADL